MARTSRRVSRPLIAALTVVIVLGVVFTVHKVIRARGEVSKTVPLTLVQPAGQPTPAAHVIDVQPAPAPTPVVQPLPKPATVEPTALVTQTPTERAPSDPTPAVAPAAPVSQGEAAVPDNNTENDSSGLKDWAKGAKPIAPNAIASAAISPAVEAPTRSGATSPLPAQPVHETPAPAAHSEISAEPGDAKAKMDAGDLIGAREILNSALIAGRGDAAALKKQIETINQSLIFSARKFPDDPWGGTYSVASGERLGTIAARNNVTWELLSRINGVTPKRLRSGQTIKIVKGPFYAIVTKHAFTMDLYLGAPGGPGSMFIRSFQVGLGKDNSTPTGLWMCKAGDKIRNPRYYPPKGGDVIAPDDPKNPLGGYWIAIEGLDGQALGAESYGIHGTIDPSSIGKMESMGCIRLRAEDISWVFDLLVDGKSKVLVKD